MRRGTTPTITFTIPYTADQITRGYITFEQHSETVLEFDLTDDEVTVADNTITVDLSQEQTLALGLNWCNVQLRLVLTGEIAVASNIVQFTVDRIIKQGEI